MKGGLVEMMMGQGQFTARRGRLCRLLLPNFLETKTEQAPRKRKISKGPFLFSRALGVAS